MKREIAELLAAGRNDNAVIRTEAVIHQAGPISRAFTHYKLPLIYRRMHRGGQYCFRMLVFISAITILSDSSLWNRRRR
jgi:hypothetical protein